MAGGAIMTGGGSIEGGFLTGRKLAYPLFLITLLFFLWGFSYGLLDVLNSHFQAVLDITKLQSTGLQVMYFGGGYFFFSPIAAEVLKRRGYKTTILMGLTFYSLGAIFFWPTAHYTTADNKTAAYGGFLVCTLVIACGLATLETSANSYAVIIGDPASASIRLQFCQAFNGVASFVGPLIASKYFFTGENANNLTNVQYVYLAVACLGVAVAVLYIFTKLPEVSEATLAQNAAELVLVDEEGNAIPQASFWKQYNMFFAFVAQFCYVGAQVTIGAFFINYVTENGGYDKPTASNFLSYALIIFTVGRFFAVGIAFIFAPSFIILIYSALCIALTFAASGLTGAGGVGCLMAVYWLMAPLYPTLFTMGTLGLGVHTRRGAGVLVMGVAGGAVFPPIQGAVADGASTKISMVIPAIGFIFVFAYALYFWVTRGNMALLRVADVVVATDNAGRRGSTLGGAVGGAINYVHYAAEKESVNDSGMRKASVVSHGRKQSVAFSVKGADGAHVVAAEQKGHPILL